MRGKIVQIVNIAAATGVLFFAGCSKKASEKPKTKSDLLAASTWKYSSAGIDQDGNGTIDVAAPSTLVEPCLTDNTLTFKIDKSGSIDEGALKCDGTAQVTPFNWELSNNDTQINLTTSIVVGIGNDAKIVELTESRLVLSKTVAISGIPIPVPVVVILVPR